MFYGLVLAECQHAGSTDGARQCKACQGSGWVTVVPGADGRPKPCAHANQGGHVQNCAACLGSGWAGLIRNK
jgi:hypothetical protein